MSFNGLRTELPWKSCDHSWNTKCCVAADVKEYEYLSQLASIRGSNLNSTSAETKKNCTRLIYSTEEYF